MQIYFSKASAKENTVPVLRSLWPANIMRRALKS